MLKFSILNMVRIGFYGIVLILFSCSQNAPMQMEVPESGNYNSVQLKRKIPVQLDDSPIFDIENVKRTELVQSSKGTVYYSKSINHYIGTIIGEIEGSIFTIKPFALTPPDDNLWTEPVTITMQVEKNSTDNQLTYTFGPSGCAFEPAADLWISWKEIGSEVPKLYYIDKNNMYVEQTPDEIDLILKRYRIRINHFSRYAVAYSD